MGDMMINVATVFSGIGSPEWALKRIGVDYKIKSKVPTIDFKTI